MQASNMVLSFIAVVIFCIFGYNYFDIPILNYFKSNLNMYTKIFMKITKFGIGTWYIIGSLVLFIILRLFNKNMIYANRALFVFVAISFSGIMNSIIKFVIGRSRPVELFNESLYAIKFFSFKAGVTSFPSGHANLITSLMVALCVLFPTFCIIFAIAALLVAASRVVICAHYLTDVVFGSYLGFLCTLYVKQIFEVKGLLIFP